MGILDRMTRLIRANINDMIDQSEDPAKMLDQLIREMNEQMHMARGQVAQMIAQEKELQMDYDDAARNGSEWDRKAELAVRQGKDDLAREALRRKRDNEEHAQTYAAQLQSQKEMVGKLKDQLQQLEAKYESARSNRDVLIARQKRAQAVQKVSGTMSGMKALDANDELDRMERRIRSNESRALAEQEMASSTLDSQFTALDQDVELDDELSKLKARVQGGPTAQDDDLAAMKNRVNGANALPAGSTETGVPSATGVHAADKPANQ